MVEQIRVLGISGSLRRSSYNLRLLQIAGELMPEGMCLEIFSLKGLPMYNQDLEAGPLPEPVLRLRETVAGADALLFATPEYNYSIPAALKNALEWLSRPLPDQPAPPASGKPAALLGGGGRSGTMRAQNHMRQIGHALNLLMLNRPEVLVDNVWQKFDAQGNLTDEEALKFIRQEMEALQEWVLRLRALPEGERQVAGK